MDDVSAKEYHVDYDVINNITDEVAKDENDIDDTAVEETKSEVEDETTCIRSRR